MEIALPLIKQVLIMFLLAGAGIFCFRKKWIDNEGSRQISSFLLSFVTPIIVIVSYQREFSLELLKSLMFALGLSVLTFIATIALAEIVLRKGTREQKFGLVFSNCSFFSIPIVMAILGSGAVFFLSAYLICFNILTWTYGMIVMTGSIKSLSLKKAFINPGTIGVGLGFLLFLSPVKLPDLVFQTLQNLAGLNTPLAMIVFGIFLAQIPVKSLFSDTKAWVASFLRIIVAPLIVIAIFYFVPAAYTEIKLVIVLACSAPVAISTALFARQFDQDFLSATRFVGLSTILSIVSIPSMVLLAQWFWAL